MTPEKRAEIRKRCEAATAGPWEQFSYKYASIDNGQTPQVFEQFTTADEIFVENARTDLPLALDALEAAERRVGELEAAILSTQRIMAEFKHIYPDGFPAEMEAKPEHLASQVTSLCNTQRATFQNFVDLIADRDAKSGRIATLERALAESEAKGAEDTARLDWLARSIEIECLIDGPDVEVFAVGDQIYESDHYPTLRTALDAARKEPK